jgi:putative redox protein
VIQRASLVVESPAGPGVRVAVETGNVRFHLDSGADVTDPSPIQSLLASVGACTAMDVICILRKKRQNVTSYEVEVEGERREEHPRSFTKFSIVHRFRGGELSAAAIEEAIRLSETRYCSVISTLRPGVPFASRYEILPGAAT